MNNISICIATFNGGKFIEEQLRSILCQLDTNDEVIISDDSSSDNTIDIIKSFNDNRIIILPNQKFRSPIFNFENALKHASNSLIFLSDQDDIWLDNKVAVMKKILQTKSMVVCNHSIIDSNNNIIIKSYFEIASSGKGIIKNIIKNTYFGCCIAFHKKILDIALPFPKDIPMHDSWLALVAELFFDTQFINTTLTLYRKHDNNTTTASDVNSSYSLLKKINFRLNTIKYFPLLFYRRYIKYKE